MGLLDQVIGSVVGSKTQGSGGMSPMMKALMMLVAAKAASSYMGRSEAAAPANDTTARAPAAPSGKIESGVLAGLPSLDSLLGHFRSSGHAETVDSWVGSGPNKEIAPPDLGKALGPDTLAKLERETGLPRDELLRQLSAALPQVVDKLTPEGRLPAPTERAHW